MSTHSTQSKKHILHLTSNVLSALVKSISGSIKIPSLIDVISKLNLTYVKTALFWVLEFNEK